MLQKSFLTLFCQKKKLYSIIRVKCPYLMCRGKKGPYSYFSYIGYVLSTFIFFLQKKKVPLFFIFSMSMQKYIVLTLYTL